MIMQDYIGSIKVSSLSDEEKLAGIKAPYFYRRVGDLVQLYGPRGSRASYLSKTALRDETWHHVRRDRVLLLKDTKFIVHELTHKIREEVRKKEMPDVKLNGVKSWGNGYFLEVRDTFRNESLLIYVVADAFDPEEWVSWRLLAQDSQAREIFGEKSVPYPENDKEFDAEKQRTKVVESIFRKVKQWLKDRG